ncbi:hypothetical protein SKAU_G00416200 [Synaphobranchus kaupii]|uniref:Uncharacterized protein n=1 Tax=Synaphobranchus kaupii TaxID=118154 RepID=A0A9Q1E7G7_SYNKA|nr:hypothetical protein SKAU_G00416200 [Synaphobranchus kaupii]
MDPCLDMEDSEDTPPPPDTSVVGGGNRQAGRFPSVCFSVSYFGFHLSLSLLLAFFPHLVYCQSHSVTFLTLFSISLPYLNPRLAASRRQFVV